MTKVSTVDSTSVVFNAKRFINNERESSKIKINEINNFLESNSENAKLVTSILNQIVNDPILKNQENFYDLNKNDERDTTLLKILRLSLYLENDIRKQKNLIKNNDFFKFLQSPNSNYLLTNSDLSIFDQRLSLIALIDPQLSTRVGVHLGLFGNCIKGNGTDAQIKYWLHDKGTLFIKDIYGCFAMTELGHGSNVAMLQTTAIYDLKTDSFTINTPNLLATKWWIGGAAHSATHCVCYARLLVNNKDYGVKTFVVPLRNPKTFDLLPGISIGDLGKKMGRDGIDNGWIQYHNVVIPREFMLSRFTKVIPDMNGKDVKVEIQKELDSISGYSALLSGRVNMVMDSFRFGSKFVTIATRYAVGRQQFATDPTKKEETQLIDYPLHQYRILPQLALTYLIAPAAYKLMNDYHKTLNELYSIDSKNPNSAQAFITVSLKLKNLFIESASLKATNTWFIAKLIDDLRQTCGGHGYSQYNAFGKGYNDWVVQCTWEGDNNVLSLTSAKSILKKFTDSVLKQKFNVSLDSQSFEYLNPQLIKSTLTGNLQDFTFNDLSSYYKIWEIMLIKILYSVMMKAKKLQQQQASQEFDLNILSKSLVSISKIHAIYSMLKSYYNKLSSDTESHVKDELTKDILWKLYKSFSLYFIDLHSGEFQQFQILNSTQITKFVQDPLLLQLLPAIRKECIPLTDAFKLPDEVISAPIGYFDGDIYHNYFNEILKNNSKDLSNLKAPYTTNMVNALNRGYTFDDALGGSFNKDTLERLGK